MSLALSFPAIHGAGKWIGIVKMRKEHGPPEFQGGVHLASWLGLLTAAHSSNDILAFDPRILPPAAGCARRTATFWSGPSDGFPLDGLSNQSGRRVAIASRPHDSRSDSTSSRRAACCWLLWEEYPAPRPGLPVALLFADAWVWIEPNGTGRPLSFYRSAAPSRGDARMDPIGGSID